MEDASHYNERQKQEQMFVNEERQVKVVKLRVGGTCYSELSRSKLQRLWHLPRQEVSEEVRKETNRARSDRNK